MRGWMSVSVPGAIAGWVALSKRYGKLPFADLLAPAIDIAERGYMVTPIIAGQWARAVPILQSQPGYAEHFMPYGRAPLAGELFRNPARRVAAADCRARANRSIAASSPRASWHTPRRTAADDRYRPRRPRGRLGGPPFA